MCSPPVRVSSHHWLKNRRMLREGLVLNCWDANEEVGSEIFNLLSHTLLESELCDISLYVQPNKALAKAWSLCFAFLLGVEET